jgi:putative phosphoribosyl transferase
MIFMDKKMFQNRFDAAEKLVPLLEQYKDNPEALVLAIPRGGLELGYVLARKLHLPLDVIFTKKIGFPSNPEYAIGAVSELHVFVNSNFKDIPELQEYIAHEVDSIRKVIKERNATYRKNMAPFDVKDKIVIVVDDGVATGSTMLSTLALIKEYNPKKIVVALPVASAEALKKIKEVADEVVCFTVPEFFVSVGQFYKHFDQVDDQEAIKLLQEADK